MSTAEAISFLLNESSLIDKAIAQFGLTSDPSEAGYILPDGRMLDFSGKREGGTPGMRSLDHGDISILHVDDTSISGTDGMIEFMQQAGAVRFSYINSDIVASFAVKMTASQIDVITRASVVGSYLVFEFDINIRSKRKFDITIDPIQNHAQVRQALVKANEQLG